MEPHPSRDREIRIATPNDVRFIDALQKKHAKAVSFLPKIALENYVAAARVHIALENGEPCGYLLGNESLRYQQLIKPITQAAIAMDAQRRHHGLALLELLKRNARDSGQRVIQANCREGLEANEFWHAAGFIPVAKIWHFANRNRWLICWRLPVTPIKPRWFFEPPTFAGGTNARTREIPSTEV